MINHKEVKTITNSKVVSDVKQMLILTKTYKIMRIQLDTMLAPKTPIV